MGLRAVAPGHDLKYIQEKGNSELGKVKDSYFLELGIKKI